MKIYTKTGDDGQTGLFGGPRVAKNDSRIEAYGTIDELNAVLGIARGQQPPAEINSLLARLQNELFDLGAELATPDPTAKGVPMVAKAQVESLEAAIDYFEQGLEPLRTFILPGGSPAAAALHLARTICRRAERRIVTLAENADPPLSPHLLIYVNRLSDLLFVLARVTNTAAGQEDIKWEKRESD